MLKNNILALTLVLILSACASERPTLSGVDGSAIPPAFAHFPDVPFPSEAYIDLDETSALGSGENWMAAWSLRHPTTPAAFLTFMYRKCRSSNG